MCKAKFIAEVAADPMCFPPLVRSLDMFQKELTFAQALKSHIEFTLDECLLTAEDPSYIIIY